MAKRYDASSIQALDDLEHVRKRPGMYIGSQDENGVRHILKEVVDNAIDEWLEGYATDVEVEIDTRTHQFRVADNGRGIPVETHEKTGLSALTTVFTVLQAGGKFDKQTYAVSAGLHGVGVKATNALSDALTVRVWRKGYCYAQSFVRGTPQTQEPRPQKEANVRGKHGTEVIFHPDEKIFGKHRINVDVVRKWLEETSHLCPGLRITLIIDQATETFSSEGLGHLVQTRAAQAKAKLLHAPISFATPDRKVTAALAWADGDEEESAGEHWWSFCNASATPEGGKHVDGAVKAISDVLKPLAKKDLDVRDLTDGLFAAVQVLVAEPQFKSQTKDKLLNNEARDDVYNALYPHLKAFFDANKKVADGIVSRALHLKKAREEYKKLRTSIGKTAVKKDSRGLLPDKLAAAVACKPEDRELFIVEGDSAGGSAKAARNPHYQEILPLRGKIANSARVPDSQVLSNAEISSMLTAIGAQVTGKRQVDLSNLRVGKVLLLMDADPDGSHIASLLLTFFALWLRDFVQQGYVYVVNSPLYRGVYKEQRWYAHSREELERMSGMTSPKLQVSRLKGHGEANANDLAFYAMRPESRKLWQVRFGDNDKEIIMSLMGSDSSERKILLGLS